MFSVTARVDVDMASEKKFVILCEALLYASGETNKCFFTGEKSF